MELRKETLGYQIRSRGEKEKMNKLVTDVLDLAHIIHETNEHVWISDDAMDVVIEEMLANPMKQKQVDAKPVIITNDVREEILKELVADSINYCYWVCAHDIRPHSSGSTKMRELLDDTFDGKKALRGRLEFIYELRRFYSAMLLHGFPLMDKRREHLMALSRPFLLYGATDITPHYNIPVGLMIVEMISNKQHLDQVFDFLVTQCDGYGDDPFLKRAILFFLQLNRIFNFYDGDVDEFPIPADYQVPKMLIHYNVINPSRDIAIKIAKGQHLHENSPEEMALRAAAIVACHTIGKITGWPAHMVDGWFFKRRNDVSDKPHHCCITSNY